MQFKWKVIEWCVGNLNEIRKTKSSWKNDVTPTWCKSQQPKTLNHKLCIYCNELPFRFFAIINIRNENFIRQAQICSILNLETIFEWCACAFNVICNKINWKIQPKGQMTLNMNWNIEHLLEVSKASLDWYSQEMLK